MKFAPLSLLFIQNRIASTRDDPVDMADCGEVTLPTIGYLEKEINNRYLRREKKRQCPCYWNDLFSNRKK